MCRPILFGSGIYDVRLTYVRSVRYTYISRESYGRREMYNGHGRLCVCLSISVCLSFAAFPHYCTDPDVSWGNGRGAL